MLPLGPVPVTEAAAIPRSSKIFLAAGPGTPAAEDELADGAAGACGAAASVVGAGALPAGLAAAESICPITAPTVTVSPSAAFVVKTPEASAISSTEALSVSRVTTTSSFST